MIDETMHTCPECNGRGRIEAEPTLLPLGYERGTTCWLCKGNKVVSRSKRVTWSQEMEREYKELVRFHRIKNKKE